MKLKRATMKPKSSIPGSSSTKVTGAASTLQSAGASKDSSFLWQVCAESIERDRVDIKQQAVLDGLRLGERLSDILRYQIDYQNQGLGAEELTDWADEFDAIKELYKTPHSKVGLIGALGSGKSTLLNAVLEERDLLPPSNDRAGTAAVCKVVYKHGPDGYRARILFRSRQSFTDDLNKLFKDLKAKRELQARLQGVTDDIEQQDIEEQLEDIETNTSDTLGTLQVLLGVKEEDLGVNSSEKFLDAHPLGVLGTTVEITETDRDTFLTKTKPFMDSTPGDCDGEELMKWPLIEHVTIFVKSDILKYGLELVDLPGLGDAVESRSKVAEKFSQQLDITAIVAPAIRATEEKAVIGFIKKRQEDEMRMNGKFDRNSLCVVVSKSEDMDLNGYLGSRWIAKKYPTIPGHLDRAKALDKVIRTAESGLDGPGPETLRFDTNTTLSPAGGVETARQEFIALRDSLKQAAVSIRNQVISERIQKEFRGRQMATKSSKKGPIHADSVAVFPTSARAFHEIRHPGGVKETGFPTERHTGVPQFKQWLLQVTLKKREKHLDAILNKLSALFIRMQTWISMSESTTAASTTASPHLDTIHRMHHQSLANILRNSCKRLRQIEPLKAKPAAMAECQREYPRTVDRWRYRYPDKPNSAFKLVSSIQTCILRKNGDCHKSKGKYPYEYQWVHDLASIFTDKVIKDWHHTFSEVVPGYEVRIRESLEYMWDGYKLSLDSLCVACNASHIRDTGKVQQAIENAKSELGISVHMILTKFRDGAQSVHPIFRQEIQRIMTPVFEEAYLFRGEGTVRRRDNLLKQFAAENSADMAVKACEKVEAALAELIQLHVGALEGLASGALLTVERQMKLLLGTSIVPLSPAALMNRKMLAEQIDPHLASWKVCWQKPAKQRDDHTMRGDWSIPDPELIKAKGGERGA